MPKKAENLKGKVFNELTVLSRNYERKNRTWWNCRCSCGKICIAESNKLKSGRKKSCGCKQFSLRNDLTNKKFGKLLVLERVENKNNRIRYLCQCDCGNKTVVDSNSLIKGYTKSCGCLHKKIVSENRILDLTGKTFGRLNVIGIDNSKRGLKNIYWLCECECGNVVSVASGSLTNNITKSCGCYRSECSSNRFSLQLTGKKFGMLNVMKRNGTFIGKDGTKYSQWLCKCDCGTIKTVRGHDLIRGSVSSCGCIISKGEYKIREYLNKRNIKYNTQYTFPDLKSENNYPLRFDFAIFNKRKLLFLIEYQGQQHFDSSYGWFGKQQREITDDMKKEYCNNNSIKLYEIKFNENIDNKLNDIFKSYANLVPSNY